MNADHATRFLTFRPALLSHSTLVFFGLFMITFVLFALALSVYFVICFLRQILGENIEQFPVTFFKLASNIKLVAFTTLRTGRQNASEVLSIRLIFIFHKTFALKNDSQHD